MRLSWLKTCKKKKQPEVVWNSWAGLCSTQPCFVAISSLSYCWVQFFSDGVMWAIILFGCEHNMAPCYRCKTQGSQYYTKHIMDANSHNNTTQDWHIATVSDCELKRGGNEWNWQNQGVDLALKLNVSYRAWTQQKHTCTRWILSIQGFSCCVSLEICRIFLCFCWILLHCPENSYV